MRYEPGSAVFHMNLGNLRMDADAAGAAREFQAALAIQPELPEGHYDLGIALRQTGARGAQWRSFIGRWRSGLGMRRRRVHWRRVRRSLNRAVGSRELRRSAGWRSR